MSLFNTFKNDLTTLLGNKHLKTHVIFLLSFVERKDIHIVYGTFNLYNLNLQGRILDFWNGVHMY